MKTRELPQAPEAHARYAGANALKCVAFEVEGIVCARAVQPMGRTRRPYVLLTCEDRHALMEALPTDQHWRLLSDHDTSNGMTCAAYATRVFFGYADYGGRDAHGQLRRAPWLNADDLFCNAHALWEVLAPWVAQQNGWSIRARMAAEAVRRACAFGRPA